MRGTGNSVEAKAMGGHFGRDKTCALINSKVYFPGSKDMVQQFINTFENCQHVKAGNKFEKGGDKLKSIPVPHEVWRQIGIDLITNLPRTPDGYNTLVTCIDYKSKWVESQPLKDKCAEGVARFMLDCITRHGCAKIHISDQGREFVNEVCHKFYMLSNIKHNITSAYHPQANGEVERFNRTTQEAFLKTQEFHERVIQEPDWDRKLNSILFAYRVTKQASTKYSPFVMMYGREPILPWQMEQNLMPLEPEEPQDIEQDSEGSGIELEDTIARMINLREEVLITAGNNIKKAQKHQAKAYDARHARNEFLPLSKVWRKNPLQSTKLKQLKKGPKWIGPYTVVRRNEAGNYILEDKHGKVNKKAYPPPVT